MNSKPYHHGDLRTALIEKAIEVIDEKGVEGLSLRKVAAACGVSEAAPYSHFANKSELLAAIESHALGKFASALRESLKDTAGLEGLVNMGCAFVMFFAHNRQYFDLIYSHLNVKAGGNDKNEPYDIIVNYVLRLFDSIDYPKELRQKTFTAYFSFVQGLTMTTLIDTNRDDVTAMEERARDLLTTNYLLFINTMPTPQMPDGLNEGN